MKSVVILAVVALAVTAYSPYVSQQLRPHRGLTECFVLELNPGQDASCEEVNKCLKLGYELDQS